MTSCSLRIGTADGAVGWGECVAMNEPAYSPEFVDGAEHRHHRVIFWPILMAADDLDAADVAGLLHPMHGHPMAKAALEMAVLDAELRAAGISLHDHFGGTATASRAGSASASSTRSTSCSTQVQGYVDDGYVRIKLKIEPGWDLEPVRLVRELIGPEMGLQVDANTAYGRTRHRPPLPARRVRPAADRATAARGRHPRARPAGGGVLDPGLPRRVDRVAADRGRRDRARRRRDHQHQAGPGRRLPRGASHPRSLRRPRRPGVVRRHGRDRNRPGCQRRHSPR